VKVTRLIRISFGDYQLKTIPRGMAMEVPAKSLNQQNKGAITNLQWKKSKSENVDVAPPIEWIRPLKNP